MDAEREVERKDDAHAATETADAARPAAPDGGGLPPIDPARYHIVRERARGGLGRILEVRDLRIGRVVAVKEMLGTTDAAYARFVREAIITARLEHPSIVPVHDIGRWPSGEPFYAMKLVSGRSLHDVVAETAGLEDRLALLPNVIAVADAIAYAHSQGVIHRDLKPANIVVGAFGETVVIDWGLAKAIDGAPEAALAGDPLDDAGGLTIAGAVLGTPCYMPPEQARGAEVDPRADVYALGAVLYEVLAGEPPYRAAARPIEAVLAGPPAPPEARVPAIPPELAAIVRKAMARRPDDRYGSARELAEDLRRYQAGRRVNAHVYARRTLIRRWLRRYRAPVSVAAAALVILAIVGGVSVARVIAERDVARQRADQLVLSQVRGELDRDATRALAWLRTYPADGDDPVEARTLALEAEGRGVARHVPPKDGFLAFTTDGASWIGARDGAIARYDATSGIVRERFPHAGRIERVVASPDRRTLAIVDAADTAVTLLDLTTGAARRLPAHPAPISALTASPDGAWIAAGSSDGTVRLTPTHAGDSRTLEPTGGDAYGLAFSHDSRWLLTMSAGAVAVRLTSLLDGTTRAIGAPGDLQSGDVSPDGALVALAHDDGEVSLWSTETGARLRSLGHHAGQASGVAFSPDGRWIASAGGDANVLLTSVATGAQRSLLGRDRAIDGLAFSPDGAVLATGGSEGEVRLWAVDGDGDRVLGRHVGRVVQLAFSADGRRLASRIMGDGGADARIWDVDTRHQRGLRCHRAMAYKLAVSPDGHRMATGSDDNGLCLWDPDTGESRALDGHTAIVLSLAFSPDGALLASASYDGTVRLWDLHGCARLADCAPAVRILTGHRGAVWRIAFSPDGRQLASAGDDATVRLWNVASGQARVLAGHGGGVRALAFAPDGRRLASAGADHEIRLWQLDGTATVLRGHTDRIDSVAFAPDGQTLWSVAEDQTLRRWDTATGAASVVAQQLGREPSFAISRDGRSIAAAGDAGHVVLVDPTTLVAYTLGRHRAAVTWLTFAPDGTQLATSGRDDTVRLWDVQRSLLTAVFQHDFQVLATAFAPDGRWLASVGRSPIVRLWSPPASRVPADPRGVAAWISTLSTAEMDPRVVASSP